MDKPEPFMLRKHGELPLDQIESDQNRLRHALAQIRKLLRDAQELIDKHRRIDH